MCRLTESYELLMRYTRGYRFPLRPDKDTTVYDPEDWWTIRSGAEKNTDQKNGQHKQTTSAQNVFFR